MPLPDNFLERLHEHDASLWSDDPAEQAAIANRLGWLDVHREMLNRLDELNTFAAWVRENDFRHAVLLGMGGSSLAPEVIQGMFGSRPGYPELIVLDTTDPETILRVETRIQFVSTLFIVSSKSGTTIETASLQRYFSERTQDITGDTGALYNFVAVTDPDTILYHLAEQQGFHHVFVNPPDIGGRYSALSMFGLVPAAAIGMDVQQFLEAADRTDHEEAAVLGERLGDLALASRDKVTFVAEPGREGLGAWAEQLIAESTGKRGKGIVPVDLEPIGAPALYGDDRVFVHLKGGEHGELHAPVAALGDAGHPVLQGSIADAHDLGREFLRWEIATAAAGAVLGINPFDEPNVSESKENTRQVLEEFVRAGRLPQPQPALEDDGLTLYIDEHTRGLLQGAQASSLEGVVGAFLGSAQPGQYVATMAYLRRSEEHDRLFERLRTVIRNATRAATTVGYGPRFLHSTGQLHKGGPDKGVFLQVTGEDATDVDIPGELAYGFGTLKGAQAAGDLQALQSRKRPVVRVHLADDVTDNLRRLVDGIEEQLSSHAGTARE